MAFTDKGGRPLINTSIARQLRSGVFTGKTQVGPETTQAITEGSLQTEADKSIEQANIQQRAQIAADQLAEQKRASVEAERLAAERLAQEKKLAEQAAAQQYAAQRKQEKGFAEGLMGS